MNKNLYMDRLGINARIASEEISKLNIKKRNLVLADFCKYLKVYSKKILAANKKDLLKVKKVKNAMTNRLIMDTKKIHQIRMSIKEIIEFPDPLSTSLKSWKRPNGIIIKKKTIPIGVIGVIYESRPNVTADVSALCFKSGNAVILKGGSEAFYSNKVLSDLFKKALKNRKCNENCVQFINSKNRLNVDYLLSSMERYIDIIIPRGGKNLVKKVKKKSKVPIIGHLEGICHVYVDRDADLKMAIRVVENAKMRNVSICGALETLLIDKACLKTHCNPILKRLSELGCLIISDAKVKKYFLGKTKLAQLKDWNTEYLAAKISVKSVNGVNDAIKHINTHGTSHTESIITKNKKTAKIFLSNVNSSIVVHNASTQFADGGEFGFGAEIGISTEKLHPRGPVGLEQLTTYKYILEGKGQIRN